MASIQTMKVVRYELGARLAVGGMAEVFLASAVLPDGSTRTVVVKRILPQCSADPSFIQMFLDEATITGRLDHPNIVRLLDLGRIDNQLFLALEYVAGMDLEELVLAVRERGQRLTLGLAAYIVSEFLKGLHHAHTRATSDGKPLAIVHRDVTPANVLLGLDGTVKIGDFGIAKAAVRYSGTIAGVIKGNFQFISPEQIAGKTAVDLRADVYGAGMVLRVLLTGQLPFDGESIPVMIDRVLRGDFAPLSTLDPETPPALDALVRKATAPKMQDRFASAEEFRLALLAVARDAGESTRAADLAAVLADCRRGKDDVRLLGSRPRVIERADSDANELSVFITNVSALPPLDDDGPTERGLHPDAPPATALAPALAPIPERPGSWPASLPDPAKTADATQLSPPPFLDPVRITAPAVARPMEATQVGAAALVSKDITASTSTPKPSLPRVGVPVPPGRDVTVQDEPVALPGPLVGQRSVRIAAHRQSVSAVAFTPDGVLVSGGNDQTLRLWELQRLTETSCLRGHTGAITCVAAGAGGRIVSGSRDKSARVWRVGRDQSEQTLLGHTGWVFAVAISPDGLLVASGGMDTTIRLWELGEGRLRRVLSGHGDAVSSLAFLTDGRLLSASYDQTLRLWRLDGSLERVLGGKVGPIRAVAVSGETAVSAGADGMLRIWDLATGALSGTMGPHEGPVVSLAFVRRPAILASASYDGTARLWDLTTRKELFRLTLENAVTALSPAPGGAFLAMGNGDGSLALWASLRAARPSSPA